MARQNGASNDSQLFLEYALRITRGRIRLMGLASSAMLIGAVTVVALLAMVAADHLAGGLDATARRWMRYAFVAVEVAAILALLIGPMIRKVSDLYAARLIEKAHPQFRNDLTAALQLGADARVHPGTLAAVRRRAAAEIGQVDVHQTVATRHVRISAIVCAASLSLFGLYSVVSPKAVLPSLRRAMGDESVAAPTTTRFLDVQPESGRRVMTGQEVTFTARVEQPSETPVLEISTDGGSTWLDDQRLRMETVSQNGPVREVRAVWPSAVASTGTAAFRISCGDAAPATGVLTVLAPPVVEVTQIQITWPEYTGRGRTLHRGPDFQALAHPETRVRIAAELNHPAASAKLHFQNGPDVLMTVDPNSPSVLRGLFPMGGDDRYRIEFDGRDRLVEGHGAWNEIKALTDKAPTIRLVQPVGRISLPADGTLVISGEADDDFGLAELALLVGPDARFDRLSLQRYRKPGPSGTTSIDVSLPVEQLGLVGQTIRCQVQVRDWSPQNAPVQSEAFFLTILPPRPAEADDDQPSDPDNPDQPGREGNDPGDQQIAENQQDPREGPLDGPQNPENQPGQGPLEADEEIQQLVRMVEEDQELLEKLDRRIVPPGGEEGQQPIGPGQEPDRQGQGPEQQQGQDEGQDQGEG
ncbi:MAG: hypothetical protein ACLFUJ_12145, partial [Phycisphaerae bacterium]